MHTPTRLSTVPFISLCVDSLRVTQRRWVVRVGQHDEHMEEHMRNGDFKRWAMRRWLQKQAYGYSDAALQQMGENPSVAPPTNPAAEETSPAIEEEPIEPPVIEPPERR